MELDLKFSKSDRTSNWGFRLVGGADFQEPLVVVKVHENSLSEKAGLEVGDVITKINNTDTATLTHSEVHDLIASAGLQFVLRIKRGEFVSPHLLQDEGREVEVRDVQVFVDEEIIDKAEQLAEILGKEIFTEFGHHRAAVNQKREKKMVYSNSTQTYIPTEDKVKQKKWSTFLIKPDRPQPQPKKTPEEQKLEDEPYKIVIKKQSRRKSLPKEKRVQFDQNIIEVEIESLSSRNQDSPELTISPDPDSIGYEQDPDSLEENNNYNNDYIDENDHQYQNEGYVEYEDENETDFDIQFRNDSLNKQYKSISEIIIDDPNSENAMTLAEQLRSLQKQLEVLSQLPSDVQTTLDAVSKQLASIVANNEEDNEDKEDPRDDASCSAEAQADGATEDEEDSIVGDELEEDLVVEEELNKILERANLEDREEEEEKTQENLEEINRIHEEELEAQRREEELFAKKEKVDKWNNSWPWSDTVKPVYRINFMKYTPPPKKLDHLQRSEVYRLIHGMEPPTKGITTRPEKILPEQDYYEASRGTP
ncbi:unnamed protein product [Psylliodes chrysocephalus]|uniref:PDZ domain-containing protein n=1 Tax=Psylliodes chrysocephalus TaxID=3402493 RepID=A0A9P0CVA6_9CUCU|nr:unnamed protein product [Psylliodes chrysocephala]